jgi:hypothetical protein
MSQDVAPPKRPLASTPGWVGPGPNKTGDHGPGAGSSYYGLPNGPKTEFTDSRVGVWNWGWSGVPDSNATEFALRRVTKYGPTVPTYTPSPLVEPGCDRLPRIGYGLWAGGYRGWVPPK